MNAAKPALTPEQLSLIHISMILPRATLLRDISITSGCFPSLGQPKASGFVPKDAFDPFHGAIAAGVLEKINDMSPASAIRSAYSPTTPQWCDRVTPNTDTPLRRARGMAFSSPARMAGKANPVSYTHLSRDARPRILSAAEPLLSVLPQ